MEYVKLGFIELFDRTDRYVSRWLLIRHALWACHLPAACGITWEGSRGVFLVNRKTFKYQYVFGTGGTKNMPRKPSLVREGGTRSVTDE